MRLITVFTLCLAALVFSGCSLGVAPATGAVNPANLPPLTGREQALIFGADGALQQGNYVAAERDYLNAVGVSTGHVAAHMALAQLYEKQRMPEKESDILKQALVFQPNHPMANYRLGKLQLNNNQYALALASFQRGRVTRPDDVDLATGEAVTRDMMGEHETAQRIYQRIMRDNPKANLANVRANLGMSYLLGGEPKKALEILKIDAKKPAVSKVAQHNLALAYGMLGRHGDARALLKGELDEESRQLAVARMREYLQQRKLGMIGAPLVPPIMMPE